MTNEELVQCIIAGEEELTPELWNQIEKFVSWRAKRFFFAYQDRCKQLSIEFDDLYQDGYFAMLQAIEKFNPSRGAKFLTVFGFYLQRQFFTAAKMRSTGWQHNKVYACESLDAMLLTSEGINYLDTIPDKSNDLETVETEVYWAVVAPAINQALNTLTNRQREILTSIYYEGKTHAATGERYGISKGGVNSTIRRSLSKLRDNAELCAACAF